MIKSRALRILKWLRGLVVENVGWKLLSLLIAVILWAVVASEPELATFATVQLQYKNLPEDLEISSEPVGSISLELRGPSGELRNLGEGGLRPSVVLDMHDVGPGQRTFAIGDGSVKLARGVYLVRAIPSMVRFDFERRREREVPVTPRFSGEGQNGYVVANWRIEPDKLEIAGPASRVARISAVSTDPVDVSGVVGSSEARVNAYVSDPYVRFTGSPQVTVSVTMKKKSGD